MAERELPLSLSGVDVGVQSESLENKSCEDLGSNPVNETLIAVDDGWGKPTPEQRINRRTIEKKVGWIDFDNPPEGIVLIGKPLPESVAFGLMQNFSRRERRSK